VVVFHQRQSNKSAK